MTEQELKNRLHEIDNFKSEYLAYDRHVSQTVDEIYFKLLSKYLRGKTSISKEILALFEERLTTKKNYFSSLIVTHQMRIQNEIQATEREIERWNKNLDFIQIPFDCPEIKEFPFGISGCIEEHKESSNFDTLINALVRFIANEPKNNYTLFKTIFFYLAKAPNFRYSEQLEFLCNQPSNKPYFRMLFQETAKFIEKTTTYKSSIVHLHEKHAALLATLSSMTHEKKNAVCEIFIDGQPRTVT